ncbi:catechol 2,3-dioxygenase-like lactoylglutathione lyase family enzyme [Melghirimyces profundicolus]|uniref:Catechol 2,3-dioxygenase-like lactoylglutathione lyase family enzyme n=1 Tax=Melghirimyces profundicolus TaxID=1242148 RepID=A0A2T6BSN3_9BACL|nr:VOC family protein [Melghirimyces profundicolus]PTX59108.1 catechol 2,3-dioxygenase-like lactoylglutathione lyase family enzyme [Melghirimyces profundicolus]
MRLFEQHLVVSDLEKSAAFYEGILRFTLGFDAGNIRFYWIDPSRRSMLGLWQRGKADSPFGPDPGEIIRQHLAFEVPAEQFEERVKELKNGGIEVVDFFGTPTEEGSVHPWVPAVSAYFSDPDGHVLELLSILPGPSRPDWEPMSGSEWRRRTAGE